MDPAHEWASAVAIRGESIVAVSYAAAPAQALDDPAIKPFVGPQTRILDLRQQFVMPGFNDAHVHIGQSAMARLDCEFCSAFARSRNSSNASAKAAKITNPANGSPVSAGSNVVAR